MHPIFGPIRQLGYVTTDIRAAVQHWRTLTGAGPWFLREPYVIDELCYQGVTYTDFSAHFAWTNSGDVQTELIQPVSDTPSIFRDFLARHPHVPAEGLLHHLAAFPDDYDAAHRRAVAAGAEIAHFGHTRGLRFTYFRFAPGGLTCFEIAESTEYSRPFREGIRQAAIGWDGTDPIRQI